MIDMSVAAITRKSPATSMSSASSSPRYAKYPSTMLEISISWISTSCSRTRCRSRSIGPWNTRSSRTVKSFFTTGHDRNDLSHPHEHDAHHLGDEPPDLRDGRDADHDDQEAEGFESLVRIAHPPRRKDERHHPRTVEWRNRQEIERGEQEIDPDGEPENVRAQRVRVPDPELVHQEVVDP